jgi:hypothetical protein
VQYPADFAVRRDPNGGARFASPNGRVEFYVCPFTDEASPAYAKAALGERLVSQKTSRLRGQTTVWRTFRGRDGFYRSVEATCSAESQWQLFGLRYKTLGDLKRHRGSYLRFKRSLTSPGC